MSTAASPPPASSPPPTLASTWQRLTWQRLQAWCQSGLDLLFPPRCTGCQRLGYSFCPNCAQAVAPIPKPICTHCGRPQPDLFQKPDGAQSGSRFAQDTPRCPQCWTGPDPLHAIRAAALYTKPLREAIHALKYEGRAELAPLLARYLVAVFQGEHGLWRDLPRSIDAVLPVPLHAQRFAERGYNQATLLAQSFAQTAGLPLVTHWLTRTRLTRQQIGLNPTERHHNVTGAFAAAPAVAGCTLLLIDDVCTTGATLRACAEAVRAQGARAIYALTLAMPGAVATFSSR